MANYIRNYNSKFDNICSNRQNKQKTFVGYTPFYHQKAVHEGLSKHGLSSGTFHIVKSSRQKGKSIMIINELLRFSINNYKKVSICISPRFDQARKLFKDTVDAIEKSGVIKNANSTLCEIKLKNGSSILFKSSLQKDGLRGLTCSGILVFDEAAFIADEIIEQCLPFSDVYKAPVLMCSTPMFKKGLFYKYYKAGLDGEKGFYAYDFNNYDTSFLLSAEKLEAYRKMLPPNIFRTEYLGEFLDGESLLFGNFYDLIKDEPYDKNPIYVGIDFSNGTGGDSTVMTSINNNNEIVNIWATNTLKPNEQIDIIIKYLNTNRSIKILLLEKNSMGAVYIDLIKKGILNSNINIIEFTTTNESKKNIIDNLIVNFNSKNISLLNNKELTSQLSYFGCLPLKNGNYTYMGLNGNHDDYVMSLAFAMEAKNNNKGKYNIL